MSAWIDLLARLGSREPDPAHTVPFPTRRVPSARVVWLNDRWFAGQGVDLGCAAVRADVVDALERRFGVIACHEGKADSVLRAEMYGVTAGSIHGGGGRTGGRDGLHAKGIGRTPLAAANTDFHHSHGSLWLYEAVREIIASEVVAAELPRGSVPILALLDTDQDIEVAGSGELARRAIIVRPDFVRPGSFERSIFFGTAGFAGSDQVRDAARVRSVVRGAVASRGRFAASPFSFADLAAGLVEQIGTGRALRLWQGQFSSANLAIDGAWTDFGAFCALPDWRWSERVLGERFGEDHRHVAATLRSVAFHVAKYGGRLDDAVPDAAAIDAAIARAFRAAVGRALDLAALPPSDAAATLDLVEECFAAQQRVRVACEDGRSRSWLGNALDEPAGAVRDRFGTTLLARYVGEGRSRHRRAATARRFLRARPELFQDAADRLFKRRVNPDGYRFTYVPADLADHIDAQVGGSRRSWRDLPAGATLLRQWQRGSASVREIEDETGSRCWRVGGVAGPHGLRVDRAVIAPGDLRRGRQVAAEGLQEWFDFDAVEPASEAVRIGKASIATPGMVDWTVPGRIDR